MEIVSAGQAEAVGPELQLVMGLAPVYVNERCAGQFPSGTVLELAGSNTRQVKETLDRA